MIKRAEDVYKESKQVENGYINFVDVFTVDKDGIYAKSCVVDNFDPRQMEDLKDDEDVLYFVFYKKPVGFIDDIEFLGSATEFSPYIFFGNRVEGNIVSNNGCILSKGNNEEITYDEAIVLYDENNCKDLRRL